MTFKGTRSELIHKFTLDVDPGYNTINKFCGGVQWYIMQTKDFVSSISFQFKKWKQSNSII